MTFAHQLADRSGDVTLRYFRKSPAVTNKLKGNGFDPVTAADQAAERTMTNLVVRTWPEHGVVGEEYGSTAHDAQFRWVLDPIDGTRAFILGQPLWGTLIGLLDGDAPVLGVMNQPFTGERYWASDTHAHFRLGDGRAKRISTRQGASLSSASLATTHPDLFTKARDAAAFQRLSKKVQMTRYGGDCYNYCLLAAGLIDLVVEVDLKPHDIVALIPIIERAGGRISTWDGKPAIHGGRIVAAGDPKLHQQAMKILMQ
ncbi:MAG: histidinol-phosphatase [Alphaproteobacteria bacterium]|nr:histidinol-phosphatase [Alphaproteobacteria bacterium]